jgi:3-deoxy-D-manno-octulosonic-acid transferase
VALTGAFGVSLCLRLMIWIYRLLFPFALVFASPYYLLRMRRRGGYGRDFSQRFGSYEGLPPRRPGVRRVWLQAVSVGEMLAVEPVLKALKAEGTEVILTTTTSTGRRLAADKLAAHVAAIAYFPIDWNPFSSSAWDAIDPDVAIVTEGERWPEHMRQARERKVPVLCINARLSDRSYKRMSVWPAASRFLLDGITRLLASSEFDAERFAALGFPRSRITVTGNIKLDVEIPRLDQAARERLRSELGLPSANLILLGSSTWPGEEEALLETLKAARARASPARSSSFPATPSAGPRWSGW